MQIRLPILLLLLLAVVLSGPVSPAAAAKVKGPKRVTPGKQVTFRVTGFRANDRLDVVLQPTVNRGGNAFGIRVKKRIVTNGRGNATLRFRWPRHYTVCLAAASPCDKIRWTPGSKADVNICGNPRRRGFVCAPQKVVRIGKPGPKPLTIPVIGRNAIFDVACPLASGCRAKVSINAGRKTLAKGRYSVPAGATRKVNLKLTRTGRQVFRRKRSVSGRATITDTSTGKRKRVGVVLRRR